MSRRKHKAPLRKHHITPRSRLPNGMDKDWNNIVLIPGDFHSAWHFIMGNLTPDEAKVFIDIVMRPGTTWTHYDLHEIRQLISRGYRKEVA